MKRLIIIPVLVLLASCGTVGDTFPMPSTMKCLKRADLVPLELGMMGIPAEEAYKHRQIAINECMWAKAGGKKD